MSKTQFANLLIGGDPSQPAAETPEERSRLAAQLFHQMINGLTSLSLCCAHLQTELRATCDDEQLKDLTTIERSVTSIADLARGLARCAQAPGTTTAARR